MAPPPARPYHTRMSAHPPNALPRQLGLFSAVAVLVGSTIGSGIFRSPAGIAERLPGPLPRLGVWVIGGLVTLCGALALAEVAGAFPHTGGVYVFLREGWGRLAAFLFGWAELVVIRAAALGAISMTFAEYFLRVLGFDPSVAPYDAWAHYVAAVAIALTSTFNIAGLRWGSLIQNLTVVAKYGALLFIVLLAMINVRGVGESVKFNVVLTLVEMLALAIVIAIGMWVMARGDADLSRVVDFEASDGTGVFIAVTTATAVAFFSMVGFEDSVNMVEETKDPERVFPRAMFTGLGIAVVIYMLVAVAVVAILSAEQITAGADSETGGLLAAVREGVPDFPVSTVFPFLTVFAVANTALINMLMASRLVYGLAKQHVLPRPLAAVLPGRRTPWAGVLFATLLALALILIVEQLAESTVTALAGTTGLLLLCVFAVVNVAVLVLRREPDTGKFKAPTAAPVIAAVACLFLAGPWARDRDDWVQYQIAGGLLVLGVVLWVVTWAINRQASRDTSIDDVDDLAG